jgi:hypothetical protein
VVEIFPKHKLQKVRKWYYEEEAGICYDVGMKIKDLQFKNLKI